jgi:hypothetical protein
MLVLSLRSLLKKHSEYIAGVLWLIMVSVFAVLLFGDEQAGKNNVATQPNVMICFISAQQ